MYNILSHHGEKEALSLRHRDMYSPGGSQCQVMDWIGFDGLARNQGTTDGLGESGEQQLALQHGEVQAETDARACAEWQVRITGKLFLAFRCETFRIKLPRVREAFLSTVQGVRSEQDDPAVGDAIAIDLDIAQCAPGESIRRRVESHCCLEDLQAVRQTCQVIICGCATLQDAINFLLYPLITLGMLAEQIPGPGESGGGCFMTCAKEGQALGQHLLIAHGVAIFVSGL